MLRILCIALLLVSWAGADVVYRAQEPVEIASYIGTDGEGTLIEFNLTALEVTEQDIDGFGTGSVFRIPGEGWGTPVGTPDLPVIRKMVMVPATGAVSVEIISSETSLLGKYTVPPFQPLPDRNGTVSPYRIDSGVYDCSEVWPSSTVEIERVSILRDIRVAWIRYSPVQVNPVTGETFITTNVNVRITAEGQGDNELQRATCGYTRSFLPLYEQVLGFEPSGDALDGSYLVITSSEAYGLCKDLIDWKRQKGYEVHIGLVPGIGSNSADIDAYIENAYNTWPTPPEYILIIGGEATVPPPYATGCAADNQYGVIGSGVDPSIHVGRLTGADTDDLAYQAWKIHTYESDPYEPAVSWFQHAVSIGSDDFQDPWMSWRYRNIFMSHGMPTTLYCPDPAYGGIYPTVALISEEVNDGTSLLSYIGHGSLTAWGTTGFNNGDVAALSNGRKLPWISSIACFNGQFPSGYCFAEAWMSEGSVSTPKGAIGIMAATTASPVGPTDSLALYQFKGYFEEEMWHMGAAFDYGKIKAYEYTGSAANSNMHMLFGCPEFDIFCETGPIPLLSATYSSIIQPGSFEVTVTAGGSPVEGSLVGAVQDTVYLDGAYTNASGIATLTIPSLPSTNDVTITASYHNRRPVQGTVTVGTGIGDSARGVAVLSLGRALPNPVSAAARIAYSLPAAGKASLQVFDITGRVVNTLADGDHISGLHNVVWNGDDFNGNPVPGGVYFYKLTTDEGSMVRSCVILR